MKRIFYFIFILFTASSMFAQKPEMVFVEGGEFYMGNDYGASDEMPEHKVTLDGFYMSKYEVTFEIFDAFCLNTGYPKTSDGGHGRGKKPAINISWEGAIKFCNWLSSRNRLEKVYEFKDTDSTEMEITKVNWDANGYRLPTEAEWEYVAKGGNKPGGFIYAGSNSLEEIAWFMNNSRGRSHDVGKLKPNELGIYDILGNAEEWCWDFYSNYKAGEETNPQGPTTGKVKVYRGGDFGTKKSLIRATKRFNMPSGMNANVLGIRLVQNKNAKN